jgi:hypothetical protein
MPKKSDDQKLTCGPKADLIKRLLDDPYNVRITRDELEDLGECLRRGITGLTDAQLKHLAEIRYWNARQQRREAEEAALAVPGAEPPPPWIRRLLEGYADAKLDPFDMRRLHGYLEQEIPGLTANQRLHLWRIFRFNENLRLRRNEAEAETDEVFAKLCGSGNRPDDGTTGRAEEGDLAASLDPLNATIETIPHSPIAHNLIRFLDSRKQKSATEREAAKHVYKSQSKDVLRRVRQLADRTSASLSCQGAPLHIVRDEGRIKLIGY